MRFMKQIRTRKENCMKIALVEDNGCIRRRFVRKSKIILMN